MNSLKTFLLMTGLIILFVYIGGLIGGRQGMITAFVFAAIMNGVSYWFSDKIVLALYRAKKADSARYARLYSVVNNLAEKAGLPAPAVYTIDADAPNAFATGRDPRHAAVAVTTGILAMLTADELEGVLAHELSHVKNRDILIQSVAAVVAGAIFMLSRMAQFAAMFGGQGSRGNNRGGANPIGLLVVALVAPVAALVIQMAISRSREYEADRSAAGITGRALSLARALARISEGARRAPLDASPATAHLFIVSPLTGGSLLTLFSTHPPVEKRIRRLEEMSMR